MAVLVELPALSHYPPLLETVALVAQAGTADSVARVALVVLAAMVELLVMARQV
jgi:3-polyprenyl-4-hydroxybenzoate decarboxylase